MGKTRIALTGRRWNDEVRGNGEGGRAIGWRKSLGSLQWNKKEETCFQRRACFEEKQNCLSKK